MIPLAAGGKGMDGVNLIPDTEANARYRAIEAALAAEWAIVKRSRNRALIAAHTDLHYQLADLAAALGVDGGPVVMSGGGGKPDRPQ